MSSEKRAVRLEERGAGTKADAFEVHSAVRAVSAIELIFMVLSVVEALPMATGDDLQMKVVISQYGIVAST